MATLQLTDSRLRVRLTLGERIAGLLLRDVDVPLDSVREVEVLPDGLRATRGIRAPGLALPGIRKIGTWRRRGERTMVSVRRGQPAVRIRLEGQPFDALLVGADDAAAVAATLSAAR
ncbi:hypothetical protein GCU60_13255 [Blastococcus saxobsidens]|uniref:Bacterial Pleckstrin homology domain-containing protein n=1 Tax=Blastococcus saxobsidens TaxID=138336 RepID=A0A6L9W3Y4_9ACTN|nr:hypothetical protein [Blastococcus saxobsidens]NEK86713.1 hypothetical protein [Blastococcus saxobsidens]